MNMTWDILARLFLMTFNNIIKRKWVAAVIALATALVVLVLVGFLSMAEGFQKALNNTGANNVAVIMSNEAQAEINSQLTREQIELLGSAPGVVRQGKHALLSPELCVIVGARKIQDDEKTNITLRGMGVNGAAMRDGFRLLNGHMPKSGSNEIIVGHKISREIKGLELGNTLRLGGVDWTVVGIFSLKGNLFEAELWADINSVQSSYNRQNQYHSVRAKFLNEQGLFDLTLFSANDVRLDLSVQTEKQYFAKQSEGLVNLVSYLAWPLALLLSVGTFTGIYNAMQISIEGRAREFVILRQIGFGRFNLFLSIIFEATLCALAGAALGGGVAYVVFDGLLAATVSNSFGGFSYALATSASVLFKAFLLSGAVAIIAVLVPASRGVNHRLTM